MEETRVKRYKEYRESIIKEDAIELEPTDDKTYIRERRKSSDTTTFLPIEEVCGATEELEEEKRLEKKDRINKIIKTSLIVGGLVIVLAALITIGIIVWRNAK